MKIYIINAIKNNININKEYHLRTKLNIFQLSKGYNFRKTKNIETIHSVIKDKAKIESFINEKINNFKIRKEQKYKNQYVPKYKDIYHKEFMQLYEYFRQTTLKTCVYKLFNNEKQQRININIPKYKLKIILNNLEKEQNNLNNIIKKNILNENKIIKTNPNIYQFYKYISINSLDKTERQISKNFLDNYRKNVNKSHIPIKDQIIPINIKDCNNLHLKKIIYNIINYKRKQKNDQMIKTINKKKINIKIIKKSQTKYTNNTRKKNRIIKQNPKTSEAKIVKKYRQKIKRVISLGKQLLH